MSKVHRNGRNNEAFFRIKKEKPFSYWHLAFSLFFLKDLPIVHASACMHAPCGWGFLDRGRLRDLGWIG
jgi:hypothetical protein